MTDQRFLRGPIGHDGYSSEKNSVKPMVGMVGTIRIGVVFAKDSKLRIGLMWQKKNTIPSTATRVIVLNREKGYK